MSTTVQITLPIGQHFFTICVYFLGVRKAFRKQHLSEKKRPKRMITLPEIVQHRNINKYMPFLYCFDQLSAKDIVLPITNPTIVAKSCGYFEKSKSCCS
jgi:hypothetical protein